MQGRGELGALGRFNNFITSTENLELEAILNELRSGVHGLSFLQNQSALRILRKGELLLSLKVVAACRREGDSSIFEEATGSGLRRFVMILGDGTVELHEFEKTVLLSRLIRHRFFADATELLEEESNFSSGEQRLRSCRFESDGVMSECLERICDARGNWQCNQMDARRGWSSSWSSAGELRYFDELHFFSHVVSPRDITEFRRNSKIGDNLITIFCSREGGRGLVKVSDSVRGCIYVTESGDYQVYNAKSELVKSARCNSALIKPAPGFLAELKKLWGLLLETMLPEAALETMLSNLQRMYPEFDPQS